MKDSRLHAYLSILGCRYTMHATLKPMDYRFHSHVSDFESMVVSPDQNLQTPVPDFDFYCFDNNRTKAHIKPNEMCIYLCLITLFLDSLNTRNLVHSIHMQLFSLDFTWYLPLVRSCTTCL